MLSPFCSSMSVVFDAEAPVGRAGESRSTAVGGMSGRFFVHSRM
jgi:hypothetical protein